MTYGSDWKAIGWGACSKCGGIRREEALTDGACKADVMCKMIATMRVKTDALYAKAQARIKEKK